MKIHTIIWRKTFSSAILNAINYILVVESTGGQPNHFGQVKEINLSNTNGRKYW